MNKLVVVGVVMGCVGLSAPASAFNPLEQSYGYVMPDKFKKYQRAEKVTATEANAPFWEKPKSLAKPNDDDGQNIEKPKKAAKNGAGQMDGGGQPHISPVKPATVSFPNSYGAGNIVIDTAGRRLYYVLSSSSAYQYPIAVGKQGFTWSGTEKISRKVAWPDWRPPAEMIERKPGLPEFMSGGIRNPLGAMALYLGNSLYRIHGTNDAKSIGTASSSGCIRMTNGNVMHLASLAGVGTTVHVLNKLPSNIAKAAKAGSAG